MTDIDIKNTRCCGTCRTPFAVCARQWRCPCHAKAAERDATARREKAARAALRGLRDPGWAGEPT